MYIAQAHSNMTTATKDQTLEARSQIPGTNHSASANTSYIYKREGSPDLCKGISNAKHMTKSQTADIKNGVSRVLKRSSFNFRVNIIYIRTDLDIIKTNILKKVQAAEAASRVLTIFP